MNTSDEFEVSGCSVLLRGYTIKQNVSILALFLLS